MGGGVRRIAATAGVEGLGALLVCCVVPLAAVALLGAAAAAPLLALDRPLVIATVAAGLGAWIWRRWQRTENAAETGSCGC